MSIRYCMVVLPEYENKHPENLTGSANVLFSLQERALSPSLIPYTPVTSVATPPAPHVSQPPTGPGPSPNTLPTGPATPSPGPVNGGSPAPTQVQTQGVSLAWAEWALRGPEHFFTVFFKLSQCVSSPVLGRGAAVGCLILCDGL